MASSMAINPASAIAATVKVMDQHGKVVHETGKTFFSAFREAKDAYRAKKAEIASQRRVEARARERLRRASTSTTSRSLQHDSDKLIECPDDRSLSSAKPKKKLPRRRHTTHGSIHDSEDVSEDDVFLARANKDSLSHSKSNDTLQSKSGTIITPGAARGVVMTENVMGMAPALFNDPSVQAVSNMLANVQSIIDELTCWTAGLSMLISELQKTPDTLAAVGLALAEISSLVRKISPVALPILKGSFPTVFALLSSPHFTLVAGTCAAATVVILGGYKIVKSVIAGAEENRMLAESEHGEILGEVMEDNLIEPRNHWTSSDYFEEPATQSVRHLSTMRALQAPPTPPPSSPEPIGFDLKDEKKRRKVEKEERRRDKEKDNRRSEKDERKKRKEQDKGRSGSTSGSSTVSKSISVGEKKTKTKDMNKSKEKDTRSKDTSKSKEKDTKSKDMDKSKEKDKPIKAIGVMKGLFDGRSSRN